MSLSPSEVVAHEVGILGEVDRLQRQAAEALATVDGFVLRWRVQSVGGAEDEKKESGESDGEKWREKYFLEFGNGTKKKGGTREMVQM